VAAARGRKLNFQTLFNVPKSSILFSHSSALLFPSSLSHLDHVYHTVFNMFTYTQDTTASEAAAHLSAHIAGKVILITGSSPKSLAETAALAIAAHKPALLILHGRSKTAIEEAQANIVRQYPSVNTRALIFDLASIESVRKGAAEVNSYPEQIDVVINSAGVMAVPFSKTVDGVETHFAVNHLAHFLFTNLIVGRLSSGARILNVTSSAYAFGGVRFDDINFEVSEAPYWRALL
jgi:hypothetical protein